MKALKMPIGPSSVPMAANSFTSPAPVAPITCPGSISRSPHANPASAIGTPSFVTCRNASVMPVSASPTVSGFGTRRLLRSTTAPAPPPAATTETATGSKILSNGLPEDGVDRVAHRRDARQNEHRDQHGEQAVLDQVLSLVVTNQIADGGEHTHHDNPLPLKMSGRGNGPAPQRVT